MYNKYRKWFVSYDFVIITEYSIKLYDVKWDPLYILIILIYFVNIVFCIKFSFIPLFYNIAPTQPPQNVSAIVLNSTSVLISWYPPPPNQQNGPIRSYTLVYIATSLTDTGSIPLETEVHIDVSESYPLISFSQMRLDNLRPFTNYTVIIFAMNDAGSSSNTSIQLRTDTAG